FEGLRLRRSHGVGILLCRRGICIAYQVFDNRFFGWEIIEQRPDGDPGRCGDVACGRRVKALLGEPLPGHLEDALPRRRFRFRSHTHGALPAASFMSTLTL